MGHGGRPRLLRVGPCVLDLQGGDLAGVRAEAGSLGRGPHHPGSSPTEHASQSRAAWPSFGPYTPKSPPSSCWLVMGENYAGGCAGAEVPAGGRETGYGLHELWGKPRAQQGLRHQQRGKPGRASWGLSQAL